MMYEIWDLDSGNRLGDFDSQNEALVELRRALDDHGDTYVASLLLNAEDDRGHTRLIAKGAELVALAREPAPATDGASARAIRSSNGAKSKRKAKPASSNGRG